MQKRGARPVGCSVSWALGLLFILLAALPGVRSVAAQTSTGTIAGTIIDPQGLAISDAAIQVRNTDTGVVNSYMTSASGIYSAPYLQPGNYEVSVTKNGFQKVVSTGVMVHVGETLTIDLQLPVQSQAETVTVTEEAPIIETEKTDESQTVSQLRDGLPPSRARWENFCAFDSRSDHRRYRGT